MAHTEEYLIEAKRILIESVTNGVSLSKAIQINKETPSRPTVYTWLDNTHKDYDESFFNNYVRAREDRADTIFEEVLIISDSTADDIITDEEGKEITNHNVIQRDRLRVDTRKWMLGKMSPKKYGDSSLLKISNPDGSKINAIFQNDLMNVPTDDSIKKDS